MERNIDIIGSNGTAATAIAEKPKEDIIWCLPHYTPMITQQRIFFEHIVSGAPSELHYFGRSVFRKNINAQNAFKFEIDIKNEIDVVI